MKKLKSIEPKVREALLNNPATRKDDFLLVYEVYNNYIPLSMPMGDALKYHKLYKLPSFASIIRVRRKLQSMDPSLCDTETVKERAEAEGDFMDYSKEV